MAGSSIRNHCRINGFKCLALLVIPASLLPQVVAFNFSYSAPTQCDTLNISWSGKRPIDLSAFTTISLSHYLALLIAGGRGPYSLLITPVCPLANRLSSMADCGPLTPPWLGNSFSNPSRIFPCLIQLSMTKLEMAHSQCS